MNALHPSPLSATLSSELAQILAEELAAGNHVLSWRAASGSRSSIHILLQQPFLVERATLPLGIAYTEIKTPEWWKVEYMHEATRDCISCGF